MAPAGKGVNYVGREPYYLGVVQAGACRLVGAAIGFEREAHGQAAGLRTFILVSVGACLMMMLSLEMEEIHRHLAVDQSVVRLDPARIASYAIASMGFLEPAPSSPARVRCGA